MLREDYSLVRKALSEQDTVQALKNFPQKEENSFITTLEKTYLKLLNGNPDINELVQYSKLVDKRVRFKASREIKTFFYIETSEGYYASEHEIVWLHILLSWGYSLRGEKEKAYVETKIASNLLSTNWSDEGRFDDPLLRIIISTLWLMNGNWYEAKVDLRIAYELDKTQKWILKLLELENPPKDFILILGGVGPEPEWDPNFKLNPLRGIRGMKFQYLSKRSSLTLSDSSKKEIPMILTPDSKNWYLRHQIRDNEIQDLIQDSK